MGDANAGHLRMQGLIPSSLPLSSAPVGAKLPPIKRSELHERSEQRARSMGKNLVLKQLNKSQQLDRLILMTRGQCEDAIDALEEAIGLSKDIEQMTEFRVTLAETLYECDLTERCIAESKMLQEYIYGTPRPDITKLDRLNVLIKKGQNDEE